MWPVGLHSPAPGTVGWVGDKTSKTTLLKTRWSGAVSGLHW